MVTIDAEANTLTMDVSDEEITRRKAAWKAPPLKVNRGTLAKYAHLVADASHGVRTQSYPTMFRFVGSVSLFWDSAYLPDMQSHIRAPYR